ncbi:MAG: DUF4440 domain-containing protein [Sphingomicrobium sp.]
MGKRIYLVALVVAAAGTGACQQAAAPAAGKLSEAEAGKIDDAAEAAWATADAAKIKAVYGPDIVGFDGSTPGLAHDRAAWDKLQDAYAAAKIDHVVQKDRVIQVLDADTFVVSGVFDVTSSAAPTAAVTLRCTDVFHKAADGSWPVVNEHCSNSPKG